MVVLKQKLPMKLTENFTLEEMISSSTALKLKINNVPDLIQQTALRKLCEEVLQPIRHRFGKPMIVTSGFRNNALNKAVKGSTTSQHLKGEAADIVSEDNIRLWTLIKGMIEEGEITVGQLIDERNLSWIHISLPTSRHRNQIFSLNQERI